LQRLPICVLNLRALRREAGCTWLVVPQLYSCTCASLQLPTRVQPLHGQRCPSESR